MLTSLLLLAAATAGQSTTDPLAPARTGSYQCAVPNKEKKTCVGITRLKLAADGSYESVTKVLLNPTPPIAMEIRTRGKVTGGQLCETIHVADFQAATIYMNDAPADESVSAAVKSQLGAAVAPLDGKNTCSAFKPAEDGLFLNEVSLDGAVRADLSQKFIWVSDKDGYSLGK